MTHFHLHILKISHNDVPCYYSPACQESLATLGDYKEVDIPICTWQQTTKKEEEASTIEKKVENEDTNTLIK